MSSTFDDLLRLMAALQASTPTPNMNNIKVATNPKLADGVEASLLYGARGIQSDLKAQLKLVKELRHKIGPPDYLAQRAAERRAAIDKGIADAFELIIRFLVSGFLDVYVDEDNQEVRNGVLPLLMTLVDRVAFVTLVTAGTEDNYRQALELIHKEMENWPTETKEGKEIIEMIGDAWFGDDSGDVPTNPNPDVFGVDYGADVDDVVFVSKKAD